MARRDRRPVAATHLPLETCRDRCWACDRPLWVRDHGHRTLATLDGLVRLTLPVRRCEHRACPLDQRPDRPEAAGRFALPHGQFGLDVIALVGALRDAERRSVPEIHLALRQRGVAIAERTVTHLLERYEELAALRLADQARLRKHRLTPGRVLRAIDGLPPDVGHEVVGILRDCLSGEVLLARSLLSATEADLAPLLQEVQRALPVPIRGIVSDGQPSLRQAVASALPGLPQQLCHFHEVRAAAHPIDEADRHAKKELKKAVRGVRPIERKLEGRQDAEAQAVRGSCLAVRRALTDDGRPPLAASGLQLVDRLEAIRASIERVGAKRGCLPSSHAWTLS